MLGEDEIKVKYIAQPNHQFDFWVDEILHTVFLIHVEYPQLSFQVDQVQYQATVAQTANQWFIHLPETGNINFVQKERFPFREEIQVAGGYEAPMPSQIIQILVKMGQEVKTNDPLMVISSMKMENTLTAVANGTVTEINVTEGQNVEAGLLLLKVE